MERGRVLDVYSDIKAQELYRIETDLKFELQSKVNWLFRSNARR